MGIGLIPIKTAPMQTGQPRPAGSTTGSDTRAVFREPDRPWPARAVAISSARSSKRIGQVCGVAQFRGRVIEPRQVLPAATRVSFRTSVVSGVSERFAEVTSTGSRNPRSRAWIEFSCAVPVTAGGAKSAQLPPTRRLMCASPLAAIGGAGKPAVRAISSNRCTSASPSTARKYPECENWPCTVAAACLPSPTLKGPTST